MTDDGMKIVTEIYTFMIGISFLIYGTLFFVSCLLFCFCKFNCSMCDTTFCFYDNFWFSLYYSLAMFYYLPVGAILLYKHKCLNAFFLTRNPYFWRLLKKVSIYSLLVDCEGFLQFLTVYQDISNISNDAYYEQEMIFGAIVLGSFRLVVSTFICTCQALTLGVVALEATGIGASTSNRRRMSHKRHNQMYGWASQIACDYLVMHFLFYMVFYSPSSPLYPLKVDYYYHYKYHFPEKLSASSQLIFSVSLITGFAFYRCVVRKKITLFNFLH